MSEKVMRWCQAGDAGAHIGPVTMALATDYTDDGGAKDLDTDAKRVALANTQNAALNALGAKFDAVLVVLETIGAINEA